MKNKKTIIISGIFILIILILFFLFYYKTQEIGNNITKSTDNIMEYILNISSYEADIEVMIKSNKTTNQYKMKQLYSKPNIVKQIIKEPSNLENLTITYDGKDIKIENTKISLSKLYKDYQYISENTLWLNTFIESYNEKSKVRETENELIIENNHQYNHYNTTQILYIDKKSSLPIKMEIQDNNKNNIIYIKYNEIKLNKLKPSEILT